MNAAGHDSETGGVCKPETALLDTIVFVGICHASVCFSRQDGCRETLMQSWGKGVHYSPPRRWIGVQALIASVAPGENGAVRN